MVEQASPVPPQLVSWSAKDFKMESDKTARVCCLAPSCGPSTEPVLNKQSLHLRVVEGEPKPASWTALLHACSSVI